MLFISVPSFYYQVLNLVLEAVCELLEQFFFFVNKMSI